jgi:ABC-type transporter Mla subunit MlaD
VSLGAPFDESGLSLRRKSGALVLLSVGLLVVALGWLPGRSLRPGFAFEVELAHAGPLRAGARVRLAGREVGTVRSLSMLEAPGAARPHLVVSVHIARAYADAVRENSEVFVATASILGEATLEIGPPRGGAAPGPPLGAGKRLRGTDPPDLDRFLVYTEEVLREILALLGEHRPDLDAFLGGLDHLLDEASGLGFTRGRLAAIYDQGREALATWRELLAALRSAGGRERLVALGARLSRLADEVGPELSALGARVERAAARLAALRELVAPERRAAFDEGAAAFRRALAQADKMVTDVRWLITRVERGRGSLGAFLQDKELFDDLHETHRIIKSQPLRFFLKSVKDKGPLAP